MTATSKVSVITITYNLIDAGREKSFIQCLESVRNQTYSNIEHIIVDGNSTDGSQDLIKKYADQSWICFVSEPDNGIYDAMNKGIKMSSGDYVAFLNSDDFWHDPMGVALSVEALEQENATFSYAPAYVLEKELPTRVIPTEIGSFFLRMPLCHQTMFTRRAALLDQKMFDVANYRSAADFNFILKLCLSGAKAVFVPKVFTSYRHGGYSATDTDISRNECAATFAQLYSSLYPGFTIQDAFDIFDEHVITERLFNKIRERVHPSIAEKMDEVKKTPVGDGRLHIDVKCFSHPIDSFQSDVPFSLLERRTTVKILGAPVIQYLKYNDGFAAKVFGVTILRGQGK